MAEYERFENDPEVSDAIRRARALSVRRQEGIGEHRLTIDEVCEKLKTSLEEGLVDNEAKIRLLRYGPNQFTPPKSKPWYLLFLREMSTGFALLLWFAGVASFVSFAIERVPEDAYLGGALIFTVLVTGIFSFYQQASSNKVFKSFKKLTPQSTFVLRDGRKQALPVEELVVGDIVYCQAGDRVPADIRVVHSESLKVDNSSITGESDPLLRTTDPCDTSALEASNLAFFSTNCIDGSGIGIVIATGDNTVMGDIAAIVSNIQDQTTPIAREISRFVKIITVISVASGLLFFGIAFWFGTTFFEAFLFMIGITVGNVPEGLLPALTVSLTITAKRMADKKCLVKHLEAVETLGSTSTICTDKTGTLTQNRMTVEHLWFGTETYIHREKKMLHDIYEESEVKMRLDWLALKRCAMLCSRAEFLDLKPDVDKRETAGDASETAILKFLEVTIGSVSEYRALYPKVAEKPFSSATKYQYSIHKNEHANTGRFLNHFLVMKGAPERIIARCTHRVDSTGTTVPIDPSFLLQFEEVYKEYGSQGERVLAFCDAELPVSDYPEMYEFDDLDSRIKLEGLRFLGLISMMDPPRPSVPEAVRLCRSAGIRVVMVTGDHPITAQAIAKMVGIITTETDSTSGATHNNHYHHNQQNGKTRHSEIEVVINPPTPVISANNHHQLNGSYPPVDEEIMSISPKFIENYHPPLNIPGDHKSTSGSFISKTSTKSDTIVPMNRSIVIPGDELEQMSEEDLARVLKNYAEIVFARTSPQQKLRIVTGFQKLGEIVAVTGDGVNDSPALKKADIGIAMGITGSEVSKQAADMILLDDNFATIVIGIEEGRRIFDNMKKTVSYILAGNVCTIYPFVVYACFGIPLAISTITTILIALGTDMVPAISLAYEKAESDIMNLPPRHPKKHRLVNSNLLYRAYLLVGIMAFVCALFAYFVAMFQNGYEPDRLWNARQKWVDSKDPFPRLVHVDGQPTYLNTTATERKQYLFQAQSAYFVGIVVFQWMDVIVCKTRRVSNFAHGMTNWVLNFSLIFETVLACFVIYTPPLNTVLQTVPVHWQCWIWALPFAAFVLVFEETRKLIIRKHPNSFFGRELLA